MVCNRGYDFISYFYFCFVLSICLPLILSQVKRRNGICMENCKVAVSTTEAVLNKSGTTASELPLFCQKLSAFCTMYCVHLSNVTQKSCTEFILFSKSDHQCLQVIYLKIFLSIFLSIAW